MKRYGVAAGVLRFDPRGIVYAVDDFDDVVAELRHAVGHRQFPGGLIVIILVGQHLLARIDVLVPRHGEDDLAGVLVGKYFFLAAGVVYDFADEQFVGDLARTIRHRFGVFGLERLGEAVVGLAGDDRQDVYLLDFAAQHGDILPLAILIHAEAQTATDLLPLADVGGALLQRADLEHVGVVPALAQRGVREDEPHRLVETEQTLLVLHDEVVGVGIVGAVLLFVDLAVDDLLALFVDGEIPGVGRLGGNSAQISLVRLARDHVVDELLDGDAVLLFEDVGIFAVHRRGTFVHLVIGDLVDEEQRQHLDPALKKFPFPLEVGDDRLADLQPPDIFVGLVDAAGVTGIEFYAVDEFHGVVAPVDALYYIAVTVSLNAVGLAIVLRQLVNVVAFVEPPHFAPDLVLAAHLEFQHRLRRLGG